MQKRLRVEKAQERKLQAKNTKDGQLPPTARRRHGRDSPSESPEESKAADTLNFKPPVFLDYEKISISCLKPLSWWYLSMAALEIQSEWLMMAHTV